jgi:hypothetical protein
MDTFEALNRAADHIEEYPSLYNFNQGHVMTPGFQHCMLARLGQISGVAYGTWCNEVSHRILGMGANDFYDAIDTRMKRGGRRDKAQDVAPAMRKLAKEYKGIPLAVKEIFKSKEIAE